MRSRTAEGATQMMPAVRRARKKSAVIASLLIPKRLYTANINKLYYCYAKGSVDIPKGVELQDFDLWRFAGKYLCCDGVAWKSFMIERIRELINRGN